MLSFWAVVLSTLASIIQSSLPEIVLGSSIRYTASSTYRMEKPLLRAVTDRIRTSIHADPRASILDDFLMRNAQAYVVAGAIRDALSSEWNGVGTGSPRDVDIAVSGVSREFFDSVLGCKGVRNRHGGYVLISQTQAAWEIWRLEDSIGLRKTNTAPSVENLLRTFNLACNALALDLRTGILTDAGAIDSIRRKQLTFVRNRIVHSQHTFAAKALLSGIRFSYSVETELQNFIATYLDHRALLHESLKTFPDLSVLFPSVNRCS